MQSRMMRMRRILEPRNLILLFPIRDAAPMSAAGFAFVAIEAAILNYVIGHADPLVRGAATLLYGVYFNVIVAGTPG
jgi:hypothetical protein